MPAATGAPAASAAVAPAGFSDTVAYNVTSPTALASTPDGRLLVTQDAGQLRVVRDGSLVSAPAVDLQPRICSEGERGLLGVAVDPAFTTNHFVYLYWTYNKFGFCGVDSAQTPVNRIARYVLGSDDKVVAGSETLLVDNVASPARIHNAGARLGGGGGTSLVTPVTVTSWANAVVQVDVPDQSIGGVQYVFSSWSDAGARAYAITTPPSAATYTALFTQ